MGKFIFITGGVVSSLGKGMASASLGMLLRARGLSVHFLKLDPYLNRDAGTMNPYQHGEVFVTDDGAETDLDLGHYERFADLTLDRHSNITSGQIYDRVLERERNGFYGGATVQVVPHVVDAIKEAFVHRESHVDVTLVELGGTVGDIEGMPFIEAIREFILERDPADVVSMHMVLLPRLAATGETKTKPAQHSAQRVYQSGLPIDYLLCRSEVPLADAHRDKLALFCNVRPENVIDVADARSIYDIPLNLHDQGFDESVVRRLRLPSRPAQLERWHAFANAVNAPAPEIRIVAIAKYVGMADCYKSLAEAFVHAGAARGLHIRLDWLPAEDLEDPAGMARLRGAAGVVVPGGFGHRGVEGKMAAIRWARETGTPFLGLCYGLHCAVVEYARHVCGAADAISGEWRGERDPDALRAALDADDPTGDWIVMLDGQGRQTPRGGTLRKGLHPCRLAPGSKARAAYGDAETVDERHRHRYEVNPARVDTLERHGLRIAGRNPVNGLVEMIELDGPGWFVATQAHPEFKSRPLSPHPLFLAFVDAAAAHDSHATETSDGPP